MPQTATINKRSLENLDRTVYTPKQSQLKARNLFTSYKVPAGTKYYTYRTLTARGAAKIIANRGTDIPLVDGDTQESSQKLVTFALAANYSKQEVQEAALAGINLDSSQGQAINRGMAEFEDKLVFVGDKDAGINGLSNAEGAQEYTFKKTFAESTPAEILAGLKEAKQLITQLNGYEDVTPVLTIPAAAYDALDVDFNEYQSRTLMEVINSRGWFSSIQKVNELAGLDGKGKDRGEMFDNSAESIQILDAQPVSREQTEYRDMTYTIPYTEQCGGLIVRAPQTIVHLKGI